MPQDGLLGTAFKTLDWAAGPSGTSSLHQAKNGKGN
jgi:hypothetical protein